MERVYLDTNAFYFFFFREKNYTEGIKKIFEKMQNGKVIGVTSCLTLDELAYVVLMRLIEKKYKKHPSEVIRGNRAIISDFIGDMEEMFGVIFSFDNLQIVEANKEIVGVIPIVMEETLLLPRDCVHLRTMLDHGCKKILSTDNDFDRIKEIERMKPESL